MEPEARFERIEALLHAMAERENQMEIRFNHRMEAAERRMDRADARMDKFGRKLDALRAIVKAGMQMMARRDVETREMKDGIRDLKDAVRELTRSQKAFLDSLRKGNGNGRRHA